MKKIKITIQESLYTLTTMLMLVGATIFPNYSTDTYAVFSHPSSSALDMLTRNGRPVTALIYKLSIMLHITDVKAIYAYTISGFICLFLAIILYQDSLRNHIKNDLFRCLVSTLTICNMYIVEFLMFLEKVSFLFAILCCVVAYRGVKRIIENESTNRKLDLCIAMISLILSACTYQPVVSFFVVLLLPIIIRKQYTWIYKIKYLFVIAFMYGGSALIDLIILKIFGSARVGSGSSIYSNLSVFWRLPLDSINSFGIVPKGFWVGTVLLIMILCLILAKRNEKLNILLHLALVFCGTEVCALSTIILGVGWFTPRIIYVFASLPMIIITFSFVNEIFLDKIDYNFSAVTKLLIAIVTINLVVVSIGFNRIYKDKYITNAFDKYRCNIIGEAINNYEKETGKTIDTIVLYKDKYLDSYERLLSSSIYFRGSSFNESWSDITAIEYYTGRKFERGEINEEIQNEFIEKDWKNYSDEQLIFQDNTLHVCRY